jgi:polyisoprenoid-binding protein YceI
MGMTKRTKIIIACVVAIAGLAAAAPWVYVNFIKEEADPEFTADDLDERLNSDTTDTSDGANTTEADDGYAPTEPDTDPPAVVTTDPVTDPATSTDGVDGDWTLGGASEVGYRIEEVLGGVDTTANGRTTAVTGSLTIAGTQATAGEFTVDMTTFQSDKGQRDNQFNNRIMTVDEFPTAMFVLTAPIEFGSVPAAGEAITATATGDLTLRGVTNSVTFEVNAQVGDDGGFGVQGQIPILFSDYEIPDPSNSFAVVKDNGLLEFVLIFQR